MRNLKRALSLALASVMLLGMMVVGTSASYPDVKATDNEEAIAVMQLLKIMEGAENIPAMVSKALLTLCHSKFTFLLLMNLLFFVAGMLMETSSIILLVVPLVYPVAESFGIDLVQFGVVTCTNLAMGMFTPPFGANIFLSASMFKRKVADVFRQAMPLIITGVIVCLLITYFPQLYMFTVK